MLKKEDLVNFENEIAELFNNAKIKAPVHLYNGNEDQIIEIFRKHNIGKDDWVLCSWRSHYQCLLKGVPPDELKEAILQGRSISLCFSDYNVLCSGIVTGVLPISTGIAMDIKRKKEKGRSGSKLSTSYASVDVAINTSLKSSIPCKMTRNGTTGRSKRSANPANIRLFRRNIRGMMVL